MRNAADCDSKLVSTSLLSRQNEVMVEPIKEKTREFHHLVQSNHQVTWKVSTDADAQADEARTLRILPEKFDLLEALF